MLSNLTQDVSLNSFEFGRVSELFAVMTYHHFSVVEPDTLGRQCYDTVFLEEHLSMARSNGIAPFITAT